MWVCCIVFCVRKCASSNGSWYAMETGEFCGLLVFLRDQNMIRRACGDSCVEHEVCMKEHEVRGGCKKGA